MQRLVTLLFLAATSCRGEPEIEKRAPEEKKSDTPVPVVEKVDPRIATAQQAVERIAGEPYVKWSTRATAPCPEDIAELLALTDDKDANDPWGRPYAMRCTANPSDFGVYSLGPDGKDGTADDVRSWKH